MTNEQTVLQVLRLGEDGLTEQGRMMLDRMIQQQLAQVQSPKEHTYVTSIPRKSKKRTRTSIK